jgi:hypothetical protein
MSDDCENTQPKRIVGRPFEPGNPGRPKGARNKQDKGAAAIDAMIADKPGDFVKVVAGLMPKEATLNINDHSELTDAELTERVRALAAQLAPFLIDGTGAAEEGTGSEGRAQIATRVH